MKTLADQIKDLENTRAAKAARMAEVIQKSINEGRSTDEAEAEEFETLDSEIKQVDQDLVRLRRLETLNAQAAKPVNDIKAVQSGSATRITGAPAIVVQKDQDEKFKGQNFTRMVIAKALGHLMQVDPARIAQNRWGKSNPTLVEIIKAGVAGGGSGSGEWGAELVQADGRYTGDFIEYLHGQTVYNRLPLREVPANITIKGQDGAATAYWVGQSKAIPATTADFSAVNLTPLKVAALAVVSNELLRDSTPAAEQLVRDALVEASAQRIDTTFLSTSAAVSGVSPAGILNGLSPMTSLGNDGVGLRRDIAQLYAPFFTAKNAGGLWLVMNNSQAKEIQLMVNALGNTEFPNINAAGGNLLGDTVITGDNVTAGHIILLKPSDIYKIGDLGVEVSISREAMIEQDSAPQGASDTPVAASATLMSMFQTESTAIKIVHPINFAKRRSSAVAYVNNADYGVSTP